MRLCGAPPSARAQQCAGQASVAAKVRLAATVILITPVAIPSALVIVMALSLSPEWVSAHAVTASSSTVLPIAEEQVCARR